MSKNAACGTCACMSVAPPAPSRAADPLRSRLDPTARPSTAGATANSLLRVAVLGKAMAARREWRRVAAVHAELQESCRQRSGGQPQQAHGAWDVLFCCTVLGVRCHPVEQVKNA
eukprot:jgi/Ulvmu1/5017/UM021_0034.1